MMDMVRTLTPEGSRLYNDYLEAAYAGAIGTPPWDALTDSRTSKPIGRDVEVQCEPHGRPFKSRYEFGVYLYRVLSALSRSEISLQAGLWNWLSLYYLDQLAPASPNGARSVLKDRAAYILDDRFVWSRYYRHLVRGPWLAVALHPVRSRVLLHPLKAAHPLGTRGEIYEQIASRQTLLRSPSVVAALDVLYYDERAGRARSGAGGSEAGSPRRFGALMNQFGLTYDLEWDDENLIPGLLPEEFERWKRA
jgi:hypothetical protein